MERVNKEVDAVKTSTIGRVGQVFKIAKTVKGQTKYEQATAIKHLDTGLLVVNQEEVKKVSVKYCKDLLTKMPLKRRSKEWLS